MHDEPQIYHFYDKRWDKVKMVPGLVFTIEPMINTGRPECKIDPDGWTARTVDGACRRSGNIQSALPKTVQ